MNNARFVFLDPHAESFYGDWERVARDCVAILRWALSFHASVDIRYPEIACPAGTTSAFQCFARAGTAPIRGLGTVHESFAYMLQNAPSGCPPPPAGYDSVQISPATVQLAVSGKGAIDISTSGTGCLNRGSFLIASEKFTVTGGSGIYTGASGSGVVKTVSLGPPAFEGDDTWSGTLIVPGLHFDLTAPKLKGTTSRTILARHRATKVRVPFNVSTTDDHDGPVQVSCQPHSGSRFPIGRTVITCSATDHSANTANASFAITVRLRH